MHEFEEAGKDDEKGRFIRSIIPTFFVANWLEISKQHKNGFRIRILNPLFLQSERPACGSFSISIGNLLNVKEKSFTIKVNRVGGIHPLTCLDDYEGGSGMRSKKYQKITAIIIILVILAMVVTSICSGLLMG